MAGRVHCPVCGSLMSHGGNYYFCSRHEYYKQIGKEIYLRGIVMVDDDKIGDNEHLAKVKTDYYDKLNKN